MKSFLEETMKLVLPLLFALISCSTQGPKFLRTPSSLQEQKIIKKNILLFAGESMPQELVIAKSLPHAPLKVEILTPSAQVHCKDVQSGKEDTSFLLAPNSQGSYNSVSCRLDSSHGTYPDQASLDVGYTVFIDEYQLPESDFKNEKELKAFVEILKTRQPWPKELVDFVQVNVPSKTLPLSSRLSSPIPVLETSEDYYLNVLGYAGSYKTKGFLGKKDHTVVGDKPWGKSSYPTINEYALVCGTNKKDGIIENVTLSAGSLGESIKLNGDFLCQYNFKRGQSDKDSSSNDGFLSITYRATTYSDLQKVVESFIQNEDQQLARKLITFHQQEMDRFEGDFREISSLMKSWDEKRKAIIKKIDLDIFNAYKSKLITDLFPEKVSGSVGKAASFISFRPVKKNIFNESGEAKSILYLNVTNKVLYKVETSEFVDKIERELPFEERLNIYLSTDEDYGSQNSSQFLICADKSQAFYAAMASIQKEDSLRYAQILSSLKKFSVESISSCVLPAEKNSVEYSRGSGKQDYVIRWAKAPLGDQEGIQATSVGNIYHSDILGSPISSELYRDRKFTHPAFSTVFPLKKGEKDKLWNEEKKLYIEYFDEDGFVKVGR